MIVDQFIDFGIRFAIQEFLSTIIFVNFVNNKIFLIEGKRDFIV